MDSVDSNSNHQIHLKHQTFSNNNNNCNTVNNNSFAGMVGLPQKETCAGCQLQIEDRFLLRVMDNSWHESCLQCSVCEEHLQRSCYVKDRKLFCKHDYDKYFGTKCSGCLQTILSSELVMRALGSVYHLRCFICVACGHQLQKGDQFVIKEAQLFCRLCYEKECAMLQMSPKTEWCPSFSPKSDDDSSSIDENESETSKGPKRPRTILTTSQRRKFKASFEINPKPCRKVRETLAAETGLSVRVVQVWFQNQRAKVKKMARRQSQTDGSDNNRKSNQQRNSKRKIKEENTGSNSSNLSSENGLTGLTVMADNQQYPTSMQGFDSNSQGVYTCNGTNIPDDLYDPDGLDQLDELMTNTQTQSNSNPPVVNPIDKLYSMQSSYFSAE